MITKERREVEIKQDLPTYTCECEQTFTVIAILRGNGFETDTGLYIRPNFCPFCGKETKSANSN
jgi:hypothetical protein